MSYDDEHPELRHPMTKEEDDQAFVDMLFAWNEAMALASEALKYGLEECERLRAELEDADRYSDDLEERCEVRDRGIKRLNERCDELSARHEEVVLERDQLISTERDLRWRIENLERELADIRYENR